MRERAVELYVVDRNVGCCVDWKLTSRFSYLVPLHPLGAHLRNTLNGYDTPRSLSRGCSRRGLSRA